MPPTHHLHISTGFAFVIGLVLVALIALIVWAFAARNARRREFELEALRIKTRAEETRESIRRGARTTPPYRPASPSAPAPSFSRPSAPPPPFYGSPSAPPAAVAPAMIHTDSGFGTGMMTGVMLGALASDHHRDTVVVRDHTPAPAAAPASSDSGFSYNSGSSDTSASSDSGGFDVSW